MCCRCLQHASNTITITVHKLVWLTESKLCFLLRCITGRKQKALKCSKPFGKQSFLNYNISFWEERAHVIFRQTDADQYSAHKSVFRKCNHNKKCSHFAPKLRAVYLIVSIILPKSTPPIAPTQ